MGIVELNSKATMIIDETLANRELVDALQASNRHVKTLVNKLIHHL